MKKCLMMMCALMALAVSAGVPPVGRTQMNVPADVPINLEINEAIVRITTLEAYAVSWDDTTSAYVVGSTPQEMGWKTILQTDGEGSPEVFDGFYGDFNIPVASNASGEVFIEAGVCLDAYKDSVVEGRFRYDTTWYIFAVPEIWLLDENADMWQTIEGTINEDGTIHFDGGFAYFIEIVANKKTYNHSLVSSDTTWLLSPVFRNINMRVPNGVHSYNLVNEHLLVTSLDSVSFDPFLQQGFGLIPRPVRPGSGKPDTGSEPSMLMSGLHKGFEAHIVHEVVLPLGPDGYIPRPVRPGKPVDEGTIKCNVSPGSGNTVLASAPHHKNSDFSKEDVSNLVTTKEDLSKLVINGYVPKGPGKPRGVDPTDSSCSTDGDRALTSGKGLDRIKDLINVNTTQGVVPRPIKPGSDKGTISPTSGSTVASAGSSNGPGSITSSRELQIQMEEPVYIWQSAEDNSIRVYNLYGNGFVCNVFDFQEDNSLILPVQMIGYDYESDSPIFNCGTDLHTVVVLGNACEITANQISWGATIPFVVDAELNNYYGPSTLTYTDGSQFIVLVFILGDVNGDGSLNIADLTALIDRLMAGTTGGEGQPASLGASDVNQDQQLNIADVTALIDLMLGGN